MQNEYRRSLVGNSTEQPLSVGVLETFYFARNELKLFQELNLVPQELSYKHCPIGTLR